MVVKHATEEGEKLLAGVPGDEKDLLASTTEQEDEATWRNLPHKRQLLLLSLCRLSTPLSNACLLPYLYYLVKSILSEPDHPTAPQQISRLTGVLVAAYPLGQMSTSMIWGRLSDIYGRKPVILFGLLINVIANLAFGFSRSIGMLIFWRVVAGMANGILGVMRTMTAEIVKERKHQMRAFLAPPVIFNSGRVIASAIGGCLADPVDNIPWLFGPNGLFNTSGHPEGVKWVLKYPYALPALFNGIVLAICLVLATLWLRESLSTKENHRDIGLATGEALSRFFKKKILRRPTEGYALIEIDDAETGSSNSTAATSPSSTPASTKRIRNTTLKDIWTRKLLKTLLAFGLLPLHTATFLHIFPVFLSMPVASHLRPSIIHFTGGLGLASPTIGIYLAIFGIAGILLQLFIYPRVHALVGTLGVFRLAGSIFPLAYIFAPFLALLSGEVYGKWAAMAAILFTQVIARTMAIPSSVLLLTETAPRRGVLGTIHGAGNTVSALASACGPAIGGMLLAKGIEINMVGLVWWAWLCLVSLVTFAWSFTLDRDQKDDTIAAGE